MVSGGYQLCHRSGEIHIFTTMPAVRSDEIKIAVKICRFDAFYSCDRILIGPQKRKTAGFPPPP